MLYKAAGSIPEHDTLRPDRLASGLNEGAAASLRCAGAGTWDARNKYLAFTFASASTRYKITPKFPQPCK